MSDFYRARPVLVRAWRIVSASGLHPDGSRRIMLENMNSVVASSGMLARITPSEGDYWVVQQDGYAYLNPKAVFEAKYEPFEPHTEPAA